MMMMTMTNYLSFKAITSIALAALILAPSLAIAKPIKADDIIGIYWSPERKSQVMIYKAKSGKYDGKIIWSKTPGKLDENNPNISLRDRPLKGLDILKDFVFDGDDEWENGTIYDPVSGNTYDSYMTFKSDNKLKVRGYIGVSLFGRTAIFEKIK